MRDGVADFVQRFDQDTVGKRLTIDQHAIAIEYHQVPIVMNAVIANRVGLTGGAISSACLPALRGFAGISTP